MANLYSAEKRITNRDGVVKQYLSDISNIDMFPNAEAEAECAFKAANGDAKAKHELVTRNLRFVVSVAKSYVVEGVYLEDLINEGNIGLIKAVEKFNPQRRVKFSTYACWWIKQGIRRALSNKSRLIRIPVHLIAARSKIVKYIDKYKIKKMLPGLLLTLEVRSWRRQRQQC